MRLEIVLSCKGIMPPRKTCPHCDFYVEDWFREWYPYEEQPKIYQGTLAADCPNADCRKGVKLTLIVEKASPDVPVVAAPSAAATKWVLNEKQGLYRICILPPVQRSGDPSYRNYKFRP